MGGDKNKKDKEKEKKIVRDDFYDKINYRESRNIFSSNEVFNPENRLYTENASFTHALWDKIKNTNKEDDGIRESLVEQEKPKKNEFSETILNSLSKLNSSTSFQPIGCKKCGHVGHYAFQCYNSIKLNTDDSKKGKQLCVNKSLDNSEIKVPKDFIMKMIGVKEGKKFYLILGEPMAKKKDKKDKKKKKDKKRERSRSRSHSKSRKEKKPEFHGDKKESKHKHEK
jgi:hypothetical protein